MDTKDKRVKREIANNNERRRMQSINAGFQKLKRLLPVNDGQKLSKASILQHAAEYIQQIQHENLSLREQNTLLRGKDNVIREDNTTNITTNTTNNIKLEHQQQSQHQQHQSHQQQQHQQQHQNQHQQHQNQNQHQQQLQPLEVLNDQPPITSVVEIISDRVAVANNSPNSSTTTASIISNNNIINNNNNKNNNNNINNNNNDAQSPACRAQAAIALPLEVPYTSETAMHSDHRHHGLNPGVPKESTPKGQNLNTILQAIVEIEGNRMQFNS